jgi:hypothetical protein
LVEKICRSVDTFSGGAPQSDDITLAVLVWTGNCIDKAGTPIGVPAEEKLS